jgi:hypothetical protein
MIVLGIITLWVVNSILGLALILVGLIMYLAQARLGNRQAENP